VNCTVLHCIPQSCTKIYRSRWTVRTDGCSFTLRFKFLCFSAYFCNRGLVFCVVWVSFCAFMYFLFLCLRESGLDVRLTSVCYQSYEHDILKTNQLILLPIGTSDLWRKGWNSQLWGSDSGQGQTMLKLEVEAQALFSTPSVVLFEYLLLIIITSIIDWLERLVSRKWTV